MNFPKLCGIGPPIAKVYSSAKARIAQSSPFRNKSGSGGDGIRFPTRQGAKQDLYLNPYHNGLIQNPVPQLTPEKCISILDDVADGNPVAREDEDKVRQAQAKVLEDAGYGPVFSGHARRESPERDQ